MCSKQAVHGVSSSTSGTGGSSSTSSFSSSISGSMGRGLGCSMSGNLARMASRRALTEATHGGVTKSGKLGEDSTGRTPGKLTTAMFPYTGKKKF